MRKLFLLSESDTTIINQSLQSLHHQYTDLIVLSPDPNIYIAKPLHHAKGLLGHTLNIIALDCRSGFPLDYFLCAANTIQKGGAFIIIWQQNDNDEQSVRFHTEKISTQNFQNYLYHGLKKYSLPLPCSLDLSLPNLDKKSFSELNIEQTLILKSLNNHKKGIITLFAPRGTGKSFLVNHFLQSLKDDFIITAPNQTALEAYKNTQVNFMAPDYLFLNNELINKSWLIIEEAAQMPIAHLERLSKLANNVLLVSSIENYEGTGKGLKDKLADVINIDKAFTLTHQHRFESHDALALFCKYISLQDEINPQLNDGIMLFSSQNIREFQSNYGLVKAFYQFMNRYHYQTNAQDIRRLFDSPDQSFVIKVDNGRIIGGLWALDEGLLTKELALDVFNGYRRPKGNLVVQTLSAHSYYPELMTFKSLRISRIAVDINHRKAGIAKSLLNHLYEYASIHQYDFLSTSFGLTESLLQFWTECNFTWIHIGSHRDKTTGLHAAVLILPITSKMQQKLKFMQTKWKNDAYHLSNAPFIHKSVKLLVKNQGHIGMYDAADESVLNAFFHHKKPKEAVFSAQIRQKNILD